MIFENPLGKSIIRLRASVERGDYALLVKQKAIAIDFPDNAGSMGRYFYSLPFGDIASEFIALQEMLNTGEINPRLTLEENFRLLIALFEQGRYTVSLYPLEIGRYQIEKAPTTYYQTRDILLWTQPASKINQKRIAHYKELIKAGKRPIAVIASMEFAFEDIVHYSPGYILDGHHKIAAYLQLGIAPIVINIHRLVNNWTEIDMDYFPIDEMLYYDTYNICHFE